MEWENLNLEKRVYIFFSTKKKNLKLKNVNYIYFFVKVLFICRKKKERKRIYFILGSFVVELIFCVFYASNFDEQFGKKKEENECWKDLKLGLDKIYVN